jgi:hypothetical protein
MHLLNKPFKRLYSAIVNATEITENNNKSTSKRRRVTVKPGNDEARIIGARKIQIWWKKRSSIYELRKIVDYLKLSLSIDDLQTLSNTCGSITRACVGDGCGLLGGSLIDMLIGRFFKTRLTLYSEFHVGECDMKLCGVGLSQKKISGKSTVALDWSKNTLASRRRYFGNHMLIINLKTERWWKVGPMKLRYNSKINYAETIEAGIYIVDRRFCRKYTVLSKNNKTNTRIDSANLYAMLKRSIFQRLFIRVPPQDKSLDFNILAAFS